MLCLLLSDDDCRFLAGVGLKVAKQSPYLLYIGCLFE